MMSRFSGMHRYSELERGVGLKLRQYGNSHAKCSSAAELESRLFRLRDDSSNRIPSVIGGDWGKGEPIGKPVVSVNTAKAGKFGKAGKSAKTGKIKGRRGIDTLFRNAYRAQLDMLSLAALKANIMISLNGLLMSMLIISGVHFISVDIWYSIPITLFLLSCALATIFAVLAARPDISGKCFEPEDFRTDKAHLLAFEEFSDLSEKQYVDAMSQMLRDDQRVYQNMISHVYELGSTADRKFRKLYCSYTVFLVGIILSVLSLLILAGVKWTNNLPPV